MSERTKEQLLPFTYDGWDEGGGDYGDIQFYKVEFVEDFGAAKVGDKFDCVTIYHKNGRMVCVTNGPKDKDGFLPEMKEMVICFKIVPV